MSFWVFKFVSFFVLAEWCVREAPIEKTKQSFWNTETTEGTEKFKMQNYFPSVGETASLILKLASPLRSLGPLCSLRFCKKVFAKLWIIGEMSAWNVEKMLKRIFFEKRFEYCLPNSWKSAKFARCLRVSSYFACVAGTFGVPSQIFSKIYKK